MWETLLDGVLRSLMRHGTLEVHMPSGRVGRYGDGTAPEVTVRLHDPAIVRRLVLSPDLAAGEGYMNATLTVDGDDLHGFLEVAMRNTSTDQQLWWRGLVRRARAAVRWLAQFNPAPRARSNVAHHYDLSGELYDLFLDPDKQYSCGYFRSTDDTLEQAQEQKKAHIAAKLLIQPGMRVLDIGCGWGGMALTLARDYKAQVLGITLSEEQLKIARERAEAEGLSERVEFRLQDYREVTGRFDRVVSIGMFEHVGVPHYRAFFRHVHDLLNEDGVALIHTIGRSEPPGSTNPWMAKYIFPGGYIPAISEAMAAVEKEQLWAADIEIWRLHYAETLRHWEQRFSTNIERARALYDGRFCRMWRFYLVACEQAFRYNWQCVFQFQLARKRDAVPLTRDYLYRGDTSLRAAAE